MNSASADVGDQVMDEEQEDVMSVETVDDDAMMDRTVDMPEDDVANMFMDNDEDIDE